MRLAVYVPVAQAGTTFDNLAATGKLAIFFCRPRDYRAVQVKGTLVSLRLAGDADREIADGYVLAWRELNLSIGVPLDVIKNIAYWPSMRVDLAITAVFDQTPGPRAGVAL